jgi:hypothetical protein
MIQEPAFTTFREMGINQWLVFGFAYLIIPLLLICIIEFTVHGVPESETGWLFKAQRILSKFPLSKTEHVEQICLLIISIYYLFGVPSKIANNLMGNNLIETKRIK